MLGENKMKMHKKEKQRLCKQGKHDALISTHMSKVISCLNYEPWRELCKHCVKRDGFEEQKTEIFMYHSPARISVWLIITDVLQTWALSVQFI